MKSETEKPVAFDIRVLDDQVDALLSVVERAKWSLPAFMRRRDLGAKMPGVEMSALFRQADSLERHVEQLHSTTNGLREQAEYLYELANMFADRAQMDGWRPELTQTDWCRALLLLSTGGHRFSIEPEPSVQP